MAFAIPIREKVRIPAEGVELEADYEAPAKPRGVIVFAHGAGSSRMSPRNRFVAIVLRRSGFATLLMDLLTEVEDYESAYRFDVALLSARLQAAVRWIAHYRPAAGLRVGLFGASTGAAAALEVAASLRGDIAAVVSRGGRPDLAAPRSLASVTAPTLLIVGGNDTGVIELNEQALERLACDKEMHLVPGATHLFEEPGALEEVAGVAAEWFGLHLERESRAA